MHKNAAYFDNKPIMWLWIPLVFMAAQLMMEAFLPPLMLEKIHAENGPHELLQFIVMVMALCVAVSTLVNARADVSRPLKSWMMLAALCCFYVAGEELSWGQQILNWGTPEFWAQVNDQAETNLHNKNSWLDQKPRLLLLVGVVVGGLIMPAIGKYKAPLLPKKFQTLYPEPHLWLIALMALVVKIIDKYAGLTGHVVFERASEIEELYLYYFVFLYLLMMRQRLTAEQ